MTNLATMNAIEPDAARSPGRREPAGGLSPEPIRAPIAPLDFRPEEFFAGRTIGGGAVRDPFGRIVRRCVVTTAAAAGAQPGSIQFQETFAYDDGEVDIWRWAITAGRDGRYVAAEESAGAGISGERRDGDYLVAFRRPVGKAQGVFAPHFASRFTLLAPDLALKYVRISLLGLPIGSLTAVHRRLLD
jgi:hypothetical protein